MKEEHLAGASAAALALAALFWGISGGIGGILMAEGWDAFVVSFYRGVIGLVFVIVWLIISPARHGLRNGWLWFWAAIAGLGVAGNFAFYFVSIAHSSVAVAATLMYCAPIFVYTISFGLGLERATVAKWISIAVVMIGILLLTQIGQLTPEGVTLVGAGAGLLAGLSYALFIFGFKYAAPHGSPQSILTIAFAVLAVILFLPGDDSQIAAALSTPDWPLFVVLGVLGAGFSFIVYIVGLRNTPPAAASIVAMVEPVTAAVFGVVILGENLSVLQLFGMALIISAVTALTVKASPPQPLPAE